MKTVVLVKMVPDVSEFKFDIEKKTLIREGVRNFMNPYDRRAVEAGLRIRESLGGSVTVLSMGPPAAEEVLRDALSMGVDEAVLLTDRAFAGSDTLATARALSLALRRTTFDLVIGGKYSVDSETSQLLPEVAELLDASLVTNARKIEPLDRRSLRVEREVEDGFETFRVSLPSVLSVNEKINKARTPTLADREKAKSLPLYKWGFPMLSADPSAFGQKGSPTEVLRVFDAAYSRTPQVFEFETGKRDYLLAAIGLVRKLLSEKQSSSGHPLEVMGSGRRAWSVHLPGQAEERTSLEVISKLSELGFSTTAVVPTEISNEMILKASESGASSLLEIRTKGNSHWSSKRIALGVSAAIERNPPYVVCFPSTVRGREVAGRVAARLGLGLTGDAVDFRLREDGELVQQKPAFGGSIIAEILSKTSPQLATVRPGVFEITSRTAAALDRKVIELDTAGIEGLESEPEARERLPNLGDLDRASAILVGGYGVGSAEELTRLRKMAEEIGMAFGATRKVVDLGWAPPQLQVGLTGKSVAPELYITVGVSGAINHIIGARRAKVVLAVNNQRSAPIFKHCDVGIVGNYQEVMPEISEELKLIAQNLPKRR